MEEVKWRAPSLKKKKCCSRENIPGRACKHLLAVFPIFVAWKQSNWTFCLNFTWRQNISYWHTLWKWVHGNDSFLILLMCTIGYQRIHGACFYINSIIFKWIQSLVAIPKMKSSGARDTSYMIFLLRAVLLLCRIFKQSKPAAQTTCTCPTYCTRVREDVIMTVKREWEKEMTVRL